MVKRILIAGGGIGGLTLAMALRQVEFEAVVFEQAPALQRVGAGLTLWNNAIFALSQIGIARSICEAGSALEWAEIRTARGWLLTRSHPAGYAKKMGVPALGIHRSSLQAALLAGLPAETLCLDKRLASFEVDSKGVTAHFTDGSQERGDLLIGADGIHSAVRRGLFPEVKLRYAGYTAWRGVAQGAFDLPPHTAIEAWGRGRRFGMLWVNPHEIYWFAVQNARAGQTLHPKETKAFLQHEFARWLPPVRDLLRQTQATEILHNDIYDFLPLPGWHRGPVALLGDAAHATTPNMGQGAGQAIESAVTLAGCLALHPDDYELAFQQYEQQRHQRTAWITHQSWQIGQVAQLANPFLAGSRNLLIRLAPFAGPAMLSKAAMHKVNASWRKPGGRETAEEKISG